MTTLSEASISVVVMAYNEGPVVADVLTATAAALAALPGEHEIVVVDDGSGDQTHAAASALAASLPVPTRVLRHDRNRGPGATKRTGFDAARRELLIAIPCDNPLTTGELAAFRDAARTADIVCGYRPERPGYTWRMRWGSRVYRLLIRLLFGVRVRDTGWIKMFRRALHPWLAVESRGAFNHVEMLARARCMNLVLAEVRCPMRRRIHGSPSIARPRVIAGALAQTFGFWFRLQVLRRRPAMPPREVYCDSVGGSSTSAGSENHIT